MQDNCDTSLHNFGNQRLHVIQIGLGTNATFLHNIVGEWNEWNRTIDWLLRASSLDWSQKTQINAIAIEPVAEHANTARKLAEQLPNVAVCQVAMGEETGDCKINVLDSPEELRLDVESFQHKEFDRQLEYLRNMSCVKVQHPSFQYSAGKIEQDFGVTVRTTTVTVKMWSYRHLVEQFRFCGCDVLIVDAEGHDASILRSMLSHCKDRPDELPHVIQFESRGLCDICEDKKDVELHVTKLLQQAGYLVIPPIGMGDTRLVLELALEKNDPMSNLQWWARQNDGNLFKGTSKRPFNTL